MESRSGNGNVATCNVGHPFELHIGSMYNTCLPGAHIMSVCFEQEQRDRWARVIVRQDVQQLWLCVARSCAFVQTGLKQAA
jgi:hypothetical protein